MTSGWNAPELQVASDTKWRAQYRGLQSWYRETVLRVPAGEKAPNRLVGSMLPAEIVAANPGLNFLTPEIAAYVERRIAEVKADNGTIEVDRLRRNMLSSMPLCFNLFGHLRTVRVAAAEVLSSLLELDISQIERVEVEWAPPPAEHLGDRTAFDAFIEYRTSDGARAFLGIETKYTEPFIQASYQSDRYRALTEDPRNGFKPGAYARLTGPKTNQLWRNALLALSLRTKEGYAQGHVLVVACREDAGAVKALGGLRAELADPESLLRAVALEHLISAFSERTDTKQWATAFEGRYLLPPGLQVKT